MASTSCLSMGMCRMGIGLAVGVVLALPALLLAFISAGGGHGDYFWAKLLFPYTMIVPVLHGDPICLPLFVVACVQCPIYGGLIGAFASTRKSAFAVAGGIVGIHVVAAAICLSGASS